MEILIVYTASFAIVVNVSIVALLIYVDRKYPA